LLDYNESNVTAALHPERPQPDLPIARLEHDVLYPRPQGENEH